jgi:hypothetical protein
MEFKIVSRNRQPEPPHATLTARPSTIWEPDSVGKRLVQAFVTLDRLPRLRGPREPGGHWPGTITGWADQVAQAELEQSERQARQQISNRAIIRPTAAEMRHGYCATLQPSAFYWFGQTVCYGVESASLFRYCIGILASERGVPCARPERPTLVGRSAI